MEKISWWETSFGEEEIDKIRDSFNNNYIARGPVAKNFEKKFAEYLNVPYALTTTSGSVALLMSMITLGINPGDEVIVPNRTWIGTAHAPLILGAKVKLVDVLSDNELIDTSQIRKKITSKTKAIIPVHINGRSVNMDEINKIAKEYNLSVVEDACQAIFSKNFNSYLGAQSDIGCFSLGLKKLISSGEGGVIVTKNETLHDKLYSVRDHGVIYDKGPYSRTFGSIGCNFRFIDVLASIVDAQLSKVKKRIERVSRIYNKYVEGIEGLSSKGIKIIPVDISKGEIPLYTQILYKERSKLVDHLNRNNIFPRTFDPSLDSADYLKKTNPEEFPNSKIFAEQGMTLPCGPAQPLENIDKVIETLYSFKNGR